tara:strand:- start:391 stop:576 length:186 start_codon:yes stop_codon:yes gene_type:complete
MIYKLKDKYKDVSIAPSGKTIVLQFLNQMQMHILSKAGYSDYFDIEDNKPKDKTTKPKKSK